MVIDRVFKAKKLWKRLIASALCLNLAATSIPYAFAVGDSGTEVELQTDESQSGEIAITQDQSNALMESIFGSDFSVVETSDEGYVYELTPEGSAQLSEEILGETALSEASDDLDENANANALPEGYIDDSNDNLYTMLDELQKDPVIMSEEPSARTKKVDLVFVIDSTGSMASSIKKVKDNVAEFASYMAEKGITLRLGLIDFKDITADGVNSTVVHEVSFSPWLGVTDFITELTKIRVAGGGDTKETPIDALGHLTEGTMVWSSDAYKFAMLITDAGYKTNNQHGITGMDEMIKKLQENDIQVSVVTNSKSMTSYGELAAYTGGIQANIQDAFGTLLKDYADAVIGSTLSKKDYTILVKEAATGLPVSGAVVSWKGGSTTTSDSGVAVIGSNSVVIEDLRIERAGYETYHQDSYTLKEGGSQTITLTVDESSETVDGVPVIKENMFRDPDSASDTLYGPDIEILGKAFNLFKFKIGFDCKLFNNVSITHDSAKKTFSVMIGRDYKGEKPNSDPYWKSDYKKYKSLVQTFSDKPAKDIYNEFRTLRKNWFYSRFSG